MKIVITKEELKAALEAKTDKIVIKGELAVEIQKRLQKKKKTKKYGAIGAVGIGVAALVAAPFTGGTSLGMGAVALTGGSVAWTTVALAGVVGGMILGGAALMKGYDVKIKTLDDTEIELTKK